MLTPEPSLECIEVTRSFGGLRAVDHVSLSLDPGKVTALIGPNGAGKTTLFHLMAGLLHPEEGQILYRGREIQRLGPWRIARMGIGRLFQDVRVFDRMTALDNVLVAFPGQIGENPLWSVVRRPTANRQERRNREKAVEWLAFVGLGDHEQALAEDLSYGQQKLLAIARLLAGGADVFLLDEPAAGVNPEMVQQLLRLMGDLAREGKVVVFIEHNMNVVMEVADWVFFMDEGQITGFGSPADVLGDPEVRAAYIGL